MMGVLGALAVDVIGRSQDHDNRWYPSHAVGLCNARG